MQTQWQTECKRSRRQSANANAHVQTRSRTERTQDRSPLSVRRCVASLACFPTSSHFRMYLRSKASGGIRGHLRGISVRPPPTWSTFSGKSTTPSTGMAGLCTAEAVGGLGEAEAMSLQRFGSLGWALKGTLGVTEKRKRATRTAQASTHRQTQAQALAEAIGEEAEAIGLAGVSGTSSIYGSSVTLVARRNVNAQNAH